MTHTHKQTQSSFKPPLHCGKKKRQSDRRRNCRTDEVPFIAGCSHFTRKNTRFRASASSRKQRSCNIMQPFQCDLQAQIPKHPITTHAQAHPKQLEATVTMRQKKKANRPQPQPPHRRGTFHHRLQPLYTEKHKVSCSGFLPENRAHATSCSHYNAVCSINSQTCTYLRTWQHQMTTMKQPFQCNLQPEIQEQHRTTHTGTTTSCKTHTTLHQSQFFSDVLLCSVKSHTTLHQSQFF